MVESTTHQPGWQFNQITLASATQITQRTHGEESMTKHAKATVVAGEDLLCPPTVTQRARSVDKPTSLVFIFLKGGRGRGGARDSGQESWEL